MKNSTKANPHEDREKEITVESRRKTRSRARPHRSERENLGVEKRDSTEVSSDSTVIPTVLSASDVIETPGKLTAAQIEAVQRDYQNGFTVKQIEWMTGIRPPTIYK